MSSLNIGFYSFLIKAKKIFYVSNSGAQHLNRVGNSGKQGIIKT